MFPFSSSHKKFGDGGAPRERSGDGAIASNMIRAGGTRRRRRRSGGSCQGECVCLGERERDNKWGGKFKITIPKKTMIQLKETKKEKVFLSFSHISNR